MAKAPKCSALTQPRSSRNKSRPKPTGHTSPIWPKVYLVLLAWRSMKFDSPYYHNIHLFFVIGKCHNWTLCKMFGWNTSDIYTGVWYFEEDKTWSQLVGESGSLVPTFRPSASTPALVIQIHPLVLCIEWSTDPSGRLITIVFYHECNILTSSNFVSMWTV